MKDRKINNLITHNALLWLLIGGLSISIIQLWATNAQQRAELNYQKAFTKHIETKGLEHWNFWYNLNKNKYVKPQSNEDTIRYVFGEYGDLAVKVAKCESGLNEKSVNKQSSARGLFQVMQSWHKIDQKWLFDPMINSLVARELFESSGNSFLPHWQASFNCWGK